MCGTFAVSPDASDEATAIVMGRAGRQSIAIKFNNGGDASYVQMSHEQAQAIRARLNALFPAAEHPLDDAWEAVNTLGGWFDKNNAHDAGYDKALGDAMTAIEALGGMNPARRADLSRPLPASQTEGMAA